MSGSNDKNKWTSVLIDIDTQNDFMDPKGSLYVKGSDAIIRNLAKLIDWAEKNAVPVISTVDAHSPNDPEFKEFPPHCVVTTWGNLKLAETTMSFYRLVGLTEDNVELADEELSPAEVFERWPQVVFEKRTTSVFDNARLEKFLAEISAERFIVCGVATDYCVKAVVEKLLEMKKIVWLVDDAIAAIDPAKSEAILSGFEKRGVKRLTTEAIVKSEN
jgi:nicotinamidase/pyrazinamidase